MELIIETQHKNFYEKHSVAYEGDSGVDLFFPREIIVKSKSTLLVDLEIRCEMKHFDKKIGYFIFPRSSIYKTPIRMSNSVGIIDSTYTHNLKVAVDNTSENPYIIEKGVRLFQICNSFLSPMKVSVKNINENIEHKRGDGFGSSGI